MTFRGPGPSDQYLWECPVLQSSLHSILVAPQGLIQSFWETGHTYSAAPNLPPHEPRCVQANLCPFTADPACCRQSPYSPIPFPDHYVVIHFYYDGRVMDTKETKSIAGYNPVWNTPFLFNVPAGDIQEQQLCLEFTIMQARLYTRSCTLGRVLIGPRAPEAGLLHWKEMCCRGHVESARWHVIQPNVFSLSP
ncbi:short transient receptor potential channel 2-like [Platysternon megacephalum]|uniref:Short transient receptor potential channel 2-like n=1 Tax=Platysternon megacephalum TaxID=55544 RepID=A0A4D9E7U0_9SAUR|nr:short transient receptor potential channel 2-like [Platysternon megacephalum]